jgi:hypothetical protein
MGMRASEIEGASIVMIGSFNPAIFQPRWLGTQQLIRKEEAENAKIAMIQAELADFSTEWFQLQVLQNRFQLASNDPREFGPLRDLAAGIFSILPHTPVTMLGLSKLFHFKMPSVDSWHAIGHLLAPKEHWIAILETPGLRSMLMEGRRKEVINGGTVRVRVEPSTKVTPGLFVEINEEFKAPGDVESEGARWIPDRLNDHWDNILDYSEVVAEHLLGLVGN